MYLGEIRLNWQSLAASAIGIGLGVSLSHYTMSLFGPPLLEEFGWSRSQFALLGSIPLFTILLVPLAGRFTDRFGPRVSAMIGFTAVPLGFAAYTVMSGNLIEFFAIYLVQHIFGMLTTSMVFARIIVDRFDSARGIALSVLMTGPPLAGAVLAPILGEVIREDGWRTGFQAMAAISGLGGWLAILLTGNRKRTSPARIADAGGGGSDPRLTVAEVLALLRHPTLLLILGGMLLVNVPQVFASTQLKLALLDLGAPDTAATWMLSLYATGVIVGRFLCGLALDRVEPHLVAIVALGLPAIGFLVLASSASVVWVLAASVLLIGLAQGAEGDIGAYLVSRRFNLKNYSLLLSCVTMMIAAGSAAGSLLLSFTLGEEGHYTPFLVVAAICTVLGATLFGLTGSARARGQRTEAKTTEEEVINQAIVGEIG